MTETATRATAILLSLAVVAALFALAFSPCAGDGDVSLWRGLQSFFGVCRYPL